MQSSTFKIDAQNQGVGYTPVLMEITPIAPIDAAEVKQLFRDVWVATYPNEDEGITIADVDTFFTNQLSEDNIGRFTETISTLPGTHYYFVARIDQKIVGICEVDVLEAENKFNIIAVLPQHQGKGIGYALWQKAYEVMNDANPVPLCVARYSADAIGFYKQLGFVEDGAIPLPEEFCLPSGIVLPEIRMILRR
jgi:ribosomal protein S18 acetylase RimI-like enzyme